jgi:hypothetical protein
MSSYSLGPRAVYAAQRYSRELVESVWSGWFYDHLLDVLKNGTWREYSTEAYGRPCRFEALRDFLAHEDGLGWPSVDETLAMVEVVRDCPQALPPEKNAPAGRLQDWARDALVELEKCGVMRTARPERQATRAFNLTGPFAKPGNPHGNPDVIRVNASEGGTSATYLAARLKKAGRDDLLEQVGPKKPYRSIRAAAIEAGIIKPVPTVRLVPDPTRAAASIVDRMDRAWCIALATAIAERLRDGTGPPNLIP